MKVSRSRSVSMLVWVCIATLAWGDKAEAAAMTMNKACVVMNSYQVSNEAVIPGENFDLTLMLQNPSSTQSVNSIILSFASDMETVTPIYGQSNQYYIDAIPAGGNKEITITLHANEEITTPSIKFQIGLSYENAESASNHDEISIQIPVTTSSKIEIQNVAVPDKVNVGSKARFYVTYRNMGIDDLYNISMNITDMNTNEVKKVSLGSLLAGKAGYGEAYMNYDTVGEQKAQIAFTYEDMKGSKYTTDPYETVIETVASIDQNAAVGDTGKAVDTGNGMNHEKMALLAGIALFGFASVVLVRKFRNNEGIRI